MLSRMQQQHFFLTYQAQAVSEMTGRAAAYPPPPPNPLEGLLCTQNPDIYNDDSVIDLL